MPAFSFPNPTPLFPQIPGRTYSIKKRPTWATLEFMAVSGRRVSSPQQALPLWEMELIFEFLRDQTQNIDTYQQYRGKHEFTELSDLFLQCAGKYGQFFLDDPSDNSRTGQVIAVADGLATVYTATRTWASSALSLTEPVGGIKAIDTLYFGNVAQSTAAYTISGNAITFDIPPPNGTVISLDFSFYYLCQFLEDQHDYEQFMYNLWTLKSCKMRSVKQ